MTYIILTDFEVLINLMNPEIKNCIHHTILSYCKHKLLNNVHPL